MMALYFITLLIGSFFVLALIVALVLFAFGIETHFENYFRPWFLINWATWILAKLLMGWSYRKDLSEP